MLWHYCYMGISSYAGRQEANQYWRELARALLAREPLAAEAAAHRIMAASKDVALRLLEEKLAAPAEPGMK